MDGCNNRNNDDDDQDQNDDNDDNNNNTIDNINKVSPSPKRLMTRTARNEAEENNAIHGTTPTTTTNRGGSTTAQPKETSLVNARNGTTEPPGRCCAGVVVPHSTMQEIARANTCCTQGWMPIHTIFQWSDSQLRERLTILVVLPTGVNTRYTVAVRGGTKLKLLSIARNDWQSGSIV